MRESGVFAIKAELSSQAKEVKRSSKQTTTNSFNPSDKAKSSIPSSSSSKGNNFFNNHSHHFTSKPVISKEGKTILALHAGTATQNDINNDHSLPTLPTPIVRANLGNMNKSQVSFLYHTNIELKEEVKRLKDELKVQKDEIRDENQCSEIWKEKYYRDSSTWMKTNELLQIQLEKSALTLSEMDIRNRKMESRVNEVIMSKRELEKNITSLQNQNEKLSHQMVQLKSKLGQETEIRDDMIKKLSDSESQLILKSTQIDELAMQLNKLQKESDKTMTSLRKEMEGYRITILEKDSHLRKANVEQSELQDKLLDAKEIIKTKSHELHLQQEQIQSLENIKKEMEIAADEALNREKNHLKEIYQLGIRQKQLMKEAERMEIEGNQTLKDLNSFKIQFSKQEIINVDLKKEKVANQKQIANLISKDHENILQLQRLSEKIAELEVSQNELRLSLKRSKEFETILRKEKMDLQVENASMMTKLDGTNKALHNAESYIEELKEKVKAESHRANDLASSLSAAEKQLSKEVDEREKIHALDRDHLRQLQSSSASIHHHQDVQIKMLEKSLESKLQQISSMEIEINQLNKNIKDIETINKQLEFRNMDLANSAASEKKRMTVLKENLSSKNREVLNLQSKLKIVEQFKKHDSHHVPVPTMATEHVDRTSIESIRLRPDEDINEESIDLDESTLFVNELETVQDTVSNATKKLKHDVDNVLSKLSPSHSRSVSSKLISSETDKKSEFDVHFDNNIVILGVDEE